MRCHADMDGDCEWEHCPQLRDNEPRASGRSCPLPWSRHGCTGVFGGYYEDDDQ